MKTEMLAMILAGGQGTPFRKLTKNIAKPAVPFGGRYRIIDFTLSNCVNSGIKNVGVVTQYQPLALNSHIGNGSSWGLDGINTGVTILQPYSNSEGGKWFEEQPMRSIKTLPTLMKWTPQYVLVLSGDHISQDGLRRNAGKTQKKRCVSYCCSARSANERRFPLWYHEHR